MSAMDFVSYYNTDILTHFFILYSSYFHLYPSIHPAATIKELFSAHKIRPETGDKLVCRLFLNRFRIRKRRNT